MAKFCSPPSIRSANPTDWRHIQSLFGDNGACGGCWCMSWRLPRGGKLYDQNKGEPNRRAFKKLFEAGNVHGLLAFIDDQPVGWCAVGPKTEFPKIENSRVFKVPNSGDDWAVLCFYIQPAQRGKGLGTAMLAAAIDYARESGATMLDGFPATHSQKSKLPAAFAWTGVPEMFKTCGFEGVQRVGIKQPLYRKKF